MNQVAPSESLGRRLALAFALIAAVTAILTSTMVSVAWSQQFQGYIRSGLQGAADNWARVFSQGYESAGGWDGGWLTNVPRFGMIRDNAMQLVDNDGFIRVQDVGMHRILGAIPEKQALQPDGPVVEAPVVANGTRVGTVRVWSPSGNQLLSDLDEQFRQATRLALVGAAIIALVVAASFGAWYARRLTAPIEVITRTAQALRSGDRDARTGLRGEDEMGLLGRTFDEMADSIEADREMERRLTADVAHELRTPLQAIQATVEAMQDGVLPADEERLGIVRDETVRLGRLANGILELTRLERGSVPFEMRRIDLADSVRMVVDAHRALFESSELVLSVDLAEGVHVIGDDERLRQAVANLLSNAARYTPAGGRVEVAVRTEGDQAVISVADTGIGISDEDRARVFSRFWRADDARSRGTGGMGIGLAVVKEIVDRHAGTIGAARREGGGSVFSIKLPLAGVTES